MSHFSNTAATVLTALFLAVTVAACNANSDAVKVLETQNESLQSTVNSYQSLGPTMTAQASILTDKLTAAESDLATTRAKNNELLSQVNAQAVQPTTVVVGPSSAQQPSGTTVPGGSGDTANTPNANDTSFVFSSVVTARSKGSDGCASGEATAFSTTDAAIWVIADVRNFKRGTTFTVTWTNSADFTHQNTWTVPNDGAQICVHFYIEPKTLALKAGTYTVTLATPNLSSQPVQFTVGDSVGGASGAATAASN